ncbi:uncharacterized protein LOC124360235 [Homalodisca vitripennis]|uniref:uncharacterized protein LOC124360235 n=1 Tax=Homalodisca vitripennis TaxID=197043 RepID=UPI001EECE667|nr:uncharacterized protein LOC124360235 [Homalodisca vitripennis]
MDEQSYSRTLSYVVCELTMPVKRHVYNFAVNNQGSLNHHLLTAAVKAIGQWKHTNSKSRKISLNRPLNNGVSSRKIKSIAVKNKDSDQVQQISEECVLEETVVEEEPSFDNMVLKKDMNSSSKMDTPEKIEISCESDDHIVKTVDISSKTHFVYQDSNNSTCGIIEGNMTNEEGLPSDESDFVGAGINFNTDCEVIHYDNNSDSCDDMSNFYSDPLLLCSDEGFKTMFRITRSSYQNLLELLSKEEMEPIENVPLYKKLLIVLWLMGNSGSYSSAAKMFDLAEEDVANCFFDVCATLYNKCDSIIRWPTPEESNEIASRIENTFGFPEVVGVLGCSYFSISIPKEAMSRREHFNAKTRTYCISLQIVCDDKLLIRDVFPGLPGSKPMAQVLRDSPLCEQLVSKVEPRLVESHRHILARKEYPQLTSMLTPYISKQGCSLSTEEEEFNRLHEGVCVLVDKTLQMLRDRFLILKLLDPEIATMVLVSACVLHNICIENDDMF